MDAYQVSDKGRARQENEDNTLIIRVSSAGSAGAQERYFLALADGMGGHRGGEVASSLAVRKAAEYVFPALSSPEERDWPALLDKSLKEANARIYGMACSDPSLEGMGTTLVCAIVSANRLYAANIGDSRMYLIDRERMDIRQITKDHSVVGELVESGGITKAEARNHPQRGRLTRSLGFHPSAEADIFSLEPEPGTVVLLCSDGLTDVLTDAQIMDAVVSAADLKEAGCALVDAANNSGGPDNISVILLRI
jgi:protein phosphatase